MHTLNQKVPFNHNLCKENETSGVAAFKPGLNKNLGYNEVIIIACDRVIAPNGEVKLCYRNCAEIIILV